MPVIPPSCAQHEAPRQRQQHPAGAERDVQGPHGAERHHQVGGQEPLRIDLTHPEFLQQAVAFANWVCSRSSARPFAQRNLLAEPHPATQVLKDSKA